jgi:putative spermidine/putrescine transport system substrate-binding protein
MMRLEQFFIALAALCLLLGTAIAQQPAGDPEAEAFREAFLAGELDWEQVLERARAEGSVNWFHWGGSDTLNTWIETVVRPELAQLGITLNTSRVPNTRDAVDLVLADARVGRGLGQGSVDAIWINGENFFTLATQDLLFGPFADKLPNSRYFFLDPDDPRSDINLYDFGYPTDFQEIPWASAQYICTIDTARLPRENAPQNFEDLEAWLRADPGRFTYVKPPHFQGNTFVQTVLYAFNPDGTGYETFQKSRDEFTPEEFARVIQPGFEYLKRIEPFLLGGGGQDGRRGSPIYPENNVMNEGLFVNGEVDMLCRFGVYNTATNIERGIFPETAENIIFPESGMITNKSFIAIPGNAPNPAAALVLVNYLSSPESQLSKLATIGNTLGIDTPLLDPELQAEVAEVSPLLHGVTAEMLAEASVPDTNASLVEIIETIWLEHIERQSPRSIEELVREAFAARQ